MLACHRALVPAMLSAWDALLQLFIHTADCRPQIQYPQALGHLCPAACYNLSLLYFFYGTCPYLKSPPYVLIITE